MGRPAFVGRRSTFMGRPAFVGRRSAFMGRSGFVGRPAFVGERFARSNWNRGRRHFDDHRHFNDHRHFRNRNANVFFVGGGGYPWYYPYYDTAGYGYGYGYDPYYDYDYGYDTAYEPQATVAYAQPYQPYVRGRAVEASIVDIQRSLKRMGYYDGAIDGIVGPQTRAAIRAYQADRGLRPTGRINNTLLRSM